MRLTEKQHRKVAVLCGTNPVLNYWRVGAIVCSVALEAVLTVLGNESHAEAGG